MRFLSYVFGGQILSTIIEYQQNNFWIACDSKIMLLVNSFAISQYLATGAALPDLREIAGVLSLFLAIQMMFRK